MSRTLLHPLRNIPQYYTQRKSKTHYQEIIKLEYKTYNIIGQSIWDQHLTHIPWKEAVCKNTFISYTWPENNNIHTIALCN